MPSTLHIRRKIRSIKSTKQITRAMELVSAAKMKRATAQTLKLRPFAQHALALLALLGEKSDPKLSPLLKKRDGHRYLVLLIASDRGLCGSFHTMLFRKLMEFEKSRMKIEQSRFDYIAVGKKGQDFLARTGRNAVSVYPSVSHTVKLEEILPIAKQILADYKKEFYDHVVIMYQNFVSALVQIPTVFQLLPFSTKVFEEMAEVLRGPTSPGARTSFTAAEEYLFEPSPQFILNHFLPKLIEMQIFQAFLETAASEHSSRMVAMKNATTNANDLMQALTLEFNGIRQAAITQEIAEISAGRIALGF